MGRVPVDPLAVDSIEISRGPNANVFGLGNPSGTVNMVPSSAHLQRSHSQVALRADSHDGFRTSVDFNRVLSKGRLALRGSAAFQRDGYVRKPSGTDTVRYNGMVKYQPFRFTTLTGSYSYYRMSGSRPNVTPPRDNVSYWIASGRPTWDPVAQVVHVDNRTLGPFSADAQVPDYFTRPGAFTQASHLYIDRSGVAYWSTASSNTGTTPTLSAQPIRLFETSPGAGSLTQGRFNAQPLFSTTRTVSDKSIYDWASVSLASANWLEDITHTYSVQWDQVIFHHPRHTLAAQLGFTREDAERFQRTPMGDAGISGSTGQLSIDVNERRLDGTANPFFLRPYVGVLLPLHKKRPALWDTTRAQVAYRLDLGKEKGWLRWLGQLQMTGYDEFKYRISRVYSFRDVLASDHPWLPAGTPRGASGAVTGGRPVGPAVLRAYYRYYVGDNAGANVDYGPSRYQNGPTSFVWGGYTLANNLPVAGSENFRMEPAVLGEAASTDGAGAGNNLKQIIKTRGAVAQHQLFDGRLVGTFGLRDDRSYTKFGNAPQLIGPDGMSFDYPTLDHWAAGDYRLSRGRTKTAGFVFRPFRDFRSGPESRTGLVGELLRGVSLTFNRSDNFIPAAPAQDLFLRPLPNPTGTGRDYGAWINLFNERLVVRVNRYENKQLNSRLGDANTIAERVTRLDVRNADPWQLEDQATAWVTATNPTWTQPQIRAEVARQIGMSQELQNVLEAPNPPLAATNDIVAKGTEIEINLNPSRYWTVAGSFTETRSINTRVSRTVDEYVAQRMPIWTTIRDQRDGQLWWTKNYGGVQTAAQNYAVNVETPYLIIKELEGKPRPQIRRYAARFSTHYQLAGITEHPQLKRVKIGGAVRWEDKAAIGFYGRQQLPATITALDSSRPIWDRSRAYFDAFASYRLRLWADRIGATVQLNVRNLQEGGRLQPIGAFPDGTPYAFRIVDPRQFIVQLSLEL
jgi:outer membrane receptor protein involved in Fe transport